jgi:hypothetical protein
VFIFVNFPCLNSILSCPASDLTLVQTALSHFGSLDLRSGAYFFAAATTNTIVYVSSDCEKHKYRFYF